MNEQFKNRTQAAEALASALKSKGLDTSTVCILGMPRGGVPMAALIADRLKVPWDVVVVKKIAAPYHPEFALGAICEDGHPFWNEEALSSLGIGKEQLEGLLQKTQIGIKEQAEKWRGSRTPLSVKDQTVILVDDGIATGMTMRAAVHSAQLRGARKILVASPVASRAAYDYFRKHVDEVLVLSIPEPFFSVGEWYETFDQVPDSLVFDLLRKPAAAEKVVQIPSNGDTLTGLLRMPCNPKGLILFAHGSGSSHKSPRNKVVANALNEYGFATLLFDLLTPAEATDRQNVFDIPFIAARLINATDWVREQEFAQGLRIGYFGASTGAAAALVAAAQYKQQNKQIVSVVSRGGRPDLADSVLDLVSCPVLLIVGGEDYGVLELNQHAKARLQKGGMVVVPGAGHLFEEAGTLAEVVQFAIEWFQKTFDSSTPTSTSTSTSTKEADL